MPKGGRKSTPAGFLVVSTGLILFLMPFIAVTRDVEVIHTSFTFIDRKEYQRWFETLEEPQIASRLTIQEC